MAKGHTYGALPDELQPGRVTGKHDTKAKKAKHKQTQNILARVLTCTWLHQFSLSLNLPITLHCRLSFQNICFGKHELQTVLDRRLQEFGRMV